MRRILCLFGLHDWGYSGWITRNESGEWRECRRCSKREEIKR